MAGSDPLAFIHDESGKNTVWRTGAPPYYDVVNKLFEAERTHVWPEGSLEEKVQRLLKTWEMELVHKVHPEDWKTVNFANFSASTNGMKAMTMAELTAIGGYNHFLRTKLPPEHRIFDPDHRILSPGEEGEKERERKKLTCGSYQAY